MLDEAIYEAAALEKVYEKTIATGLPGSRAAAAPPGTPIGGAR